VSKPTWLFVNAIADVKALPTSTITVVVIKTMIGATMMATAVWAGDELNLSPRQT
jgi:hypothetical protein